MFLTATKSNLKELWTIHTTKYVIFVQKQKQGDGVFITFKVTKLFLICVYCIRVVINWSLPVMSLLILSIIEFIRKIYDYSYDENKTDWNLINFDALPYHQKLMGISYINRYAKSLHPLTKIWYFIFCYMQYSHAKTDIITMAKISVFFVIKRRHIFFCSKQKSILRLTFFVSKLYIAFKIFSSIHLYLQFLAFLFFSYLGVCHIHKTGINLPSRRMYSV